MVTKDDDFLQKLLLTFRVEAEEHVNSISAGLIALEQAHSAGEQQHLIETVFREAHSLKGAARAVNATEIEKICQALESIFATLKREATAPSLAVFDTLHRGADALIKLLSTLDAERPALNRKEVADIVRQLQSVCDVPAQVTLRAGGNEGASHNPITIASPFTEPEIETAPATLSSEPLANEDIASRIAHPTENQPAQSKTIRIATAKLDALLLQSEELLSIKLTAQQRATDLGDVGDTLSAWRKKWGKVQTDLRAWRQAVEGKTDGNGKVDVNLKSLLEFLDWNSAFMRSLESELATLAKSADQDQRALSSGVNQLLEDVKKVLMQPAASLLEMFPKTVRDLARDRGKEVEVIVAGGETEIDRRILDELKDPLLHLVRNAVDHGIEKPEERVDKGKRASGTLTLAVMQKSGSEVEIIISDDGRGIDAQRVRAAALKHNVISAEEAGTLGEQEAHSLIFRSGISTSPIITDISGRGLGLAIVQEKVEKIGGTLALESRADAGTTFRIRAPLTLATFRGILVRAGGASFIIPTISVRRVLRASDEEIKTLEDRETIRFDGQLISLVSLGDVLGLLPREATEDAEVGAHMIVVGAAEKRIAFRVDEILDEQEVLVKRLGRQLSRVRNISGATVLGSGQVVPILNVSDLMKSAVSATALPVKVAAKTGEHEARRKSILIAEDSITARALIKNILESAGYEVKTTVDGAEAFTELKAGEYDLLVSDVEMPRMNGFELTAQVREDKKLSELPVVLVTSLDSREDRERGIDAGANAYIVKSSFDQSNLLEIVRRLI